ncbi:MAG: DNRLRE domain-containing protein, partial [Streptosporangiaceae bacterium]
MTLPLTGARALAFGVLGAAHVPGTAKGDEVTYAGARPDSDIQYVAGSGMVTERLILRSRAAPATWTFPLRLAGLRAAAGPGGVIDFTDAAGAVVAQVPHGFMTDSKINPHSGSGAYSGGVSYALTTVDGAPAIRMTLDTAWLDSSARVFPVTVDPSVTTTPENSTGTTFVESGEPGDYSGDSEIDVGTYNGGTNVAKSYLKFGSVSSALANDNVLGAELGVFNSWSESCAPRTVYVYPVTQSWSVTGSKTWPGPSTGSSIGRLSFATGWVAQGSTVSPCPAAWKDIPLDQAGTSLVYGWTHGSANNGLALGASSSDSDGWKKFTSINNPTGDPFLKVTYTTDGAGYKLASTRPVKQVTSTQNGELAVKVTNTGSSTWTPTNGYELSYEAYNSKGTRVANHPVFTAMPSTVAPGASVTLDVTIDKLPVGDYVIDFDMFSGATGSSPVSFASEYVPPLAVGLVVADPMPVVNDAYPPSGFVSPTVTPQLSVAEYSPPGSGTVTYSFSVTCDPLPDTTCPGGTFGSGPISEPYWTVSPGLQWNEPYTWSVIVNDDGTATDFGPVSLTPEVPQPVVTSQTGGTSDMAFNPQSGDYTTSATDAAVAVAGPPLDIDRSYNSLDPRTTGAFGAGWSSLIDMSVTPDGIGNNDVIVTMPDGSQARFGYNGTASNGSATYVPPMGTTDELVHSSAGAWTLMLSSGTSYSFTSAGAISGISSATGLTQSLGYSSGEVTSITDTASGRSLTLTWSTPSGAADPHVASVTTSAVASGQPGLKWTYSYSGDDLTGVCAPSGGCTSYAYGTTLSHYATSVMDAGPRSYYRLG